jgi:hypothetical protein
MGTIILPASLPKKGEQMQGLLTSSPQPKKKQDTGQVHVNRLLRKIVPFSSV